MFEKIRDHLNDIDKAGHSLAATQFPIYIEKQEALREKFKSILSSDQNKKEEDKKTEEEKMKNMSKERLHAYKRDKNNKKHVQNMTKQEREDQISNIMSRLYYGLDKMDISDDFSHLVNTGNETMDKINYYNITLIIKNVKPSITIQFESRSEEKAKTEESDQEKAKTEESGKETKKEHIEKAKTKKKEHVEKAKTEKSSKETQKKCKEKVKTQESSKKTKDYEKANP